MKRKTDSFWRDQIDLVLMLIDYQVLIKAGIKSLNKIQLNYFNLIVISYYLNLKLFRFFEQ